MRVLGWLCEAASRRLLRQELELCRYTDLTHNGRVVMIHLVSTKCFILKGPLGRQSYVPRERSAPSFDDKDVDAAGTGQARHFGLYGVNRPGFSGGNFV